MWAGASPRLSVLLVAGLFACGGRGSGSETAGATGTGSSTDPTSTGGASTSGPDATGSTATATATDTATSGTSTTGAGATGEPTGDFIDPPDGGAGGTECDPGFQDCPAGLKCTGAPAPRGECCVDANHCVPDTGDKQFGEACTRIEGDDDCAKGLFCMTMFSGTTGPGVCMEYCIAGDESSCQNGGDCVVYTDGLVPLCEIDCDPLAQTCANSMGCYWTGTRFVCAVATPPAAEGEPCDVFQSCQPGLTCVGAGRLEGCNATACCTPWCDISGADPCTPPEACLSWFKNGPPTPGHEDVGACELPP